MKKILALLLLMMISTNSYSRYVTAEGANQDIKLIIGFLFVCGFGWLLSTRYGEKFLEFSKLLFGILAISILPIISIGLFLKEEFLGGIIFGFLSVLLFIRNKK
jgi:hypothetical protein